MVHLYTSTVSIGPSPSAPLVWQRLVLALLTLFAEKEHQTDEPNHAGDNDQPTYWRLRDVAARSAPARVASARKLPHRNSSPTGRVSAHPVCAGAVAVQRALVRIHTSRPVHQHVAVRTPAHAIAARELTNAVRSAMILGLGLRAQNHARFALPTAPTGRTVAAKGCSAAQAGAVVGARRRRARIRLVAAAVFRRVCLDPSAA